MLSFRPWCLSPLVKFATVSYVPVQALVHRVFGECPLFHGGDILGRLLHVFPVASGADVIR